MNVQALSAEGLDGVYVCALNIPSDSQQLACASEANKGVYIVNYVTAAGWGGEIHLNNGANIITGSCAPWPFCTSDKRCLLLHVSTQTQEPV